MVLPSHIEVHIKKVFRTGESKSSWGTGNNLFVLLQLPGGDKKYMISTPVQGTTVSEHVTWDGPFTMTSFGETSLEISLEKEKTKLFKRSSPIGRVIIRLKPLYETNKLEGTFTLLSKDGKDCGNIVLSLKLSVPPVPLRPSIQAQTSQQEFLMPGIIGPSDLEPGHPSLPPSSSAYPQSPSHNISEQHYPQLEGRVRTTGPLDYHDPYSNRLNNSHSYLTTEQAATIGAGKDGGAHGVEGKSSYLEYGAKPAYPAIRNV